MTVAARFDRARATLDTFGEEEVTKGSLALSWYVLAVAGVLVGWWAGRAFMRTARQLAGDDKTAKGRLPALRWLIGLDVGAWALWQLTGAAIVGGADAFDGLHTLLHFVAIALAAGAIGWAGGAVAGDATQAWRRGSVVRFQLILLATLLATVLLLPVMSEQCLDVLRAWGNGLYTRAAAGIAGALLLGAVCRASATRLLLPGSTDAFLGRKLLDRVTGWLQPLTGRVTTKGRLGRAVLPWALPTGVMVGALVASGQELAAGVLVVAFVVVVATGWAEPTALVTPPVDGADEGETADRLRAESLRRLAGTLGVFPMLILLAGIWSAAADSYLLPDAGVGTDPSLFVWAGVIFVLFAALSADAHTEVEEKKSWVILGVLAGLTLIATLTTGVGPDPGDAADVVAVSLLLIVGVAVASRRVLNDGGAAELWIAGAAVVGTAVAVYSQPVVATRALGTFGLTFVGAAGLLLALHALGTLGARRSFRSNPSWLVRAPLPERVPVVTLIAVWVGIAFLAAPDTAHQVPTVETAGEPRPLAQEVADWLDREAKNPVGEGTDAYVPMVLLAGSGGGSKAAYWTDLVVDCMLGDGTPDDESDECANTSRAAARAGYGRVFMTSSVSGGSVGIRHMVRNNEDLIAGNDWVKRTAGLEALSPVAGWGLFHDLPAFMLGADLDPSKCKPGEGRACRRHADRALVQEAAVVNGTHAQLDDPRDAGLLAQRGPLTVFSSAEDGAARRILLSRAQLGPPPSLRGCPASYGLEEPVKTAIDAHDVIGPQQDIPLSAAALVSARFPVVEPPARLGTSDEKRPKGCAPPEHLSPTVARDGGYIENSGVLLLVESLAAVKRAISDWRREAGLSDDEQRRRLAVDVRLIIVSIDDDPPTSPKNELESGQRGAFGIGRQAGPAFLTAQARATAKSCTVPGVSYFRISPPPRIGAKAATGWEISETTRRKDLAQALKEGPSRLRVETLRSILAGNMKPVDEDTRGRVRCTWKPAD
ncbi:MAG TPA: hypothetical protein VEX39_07460 [Thermoleophilaceae bacterium]|nr:hypothetical protein [Thermoleophilaceae bacterium]